MMHKADPLRAFIATLILFLLPAVTCCLRTNYAEMENLARMHRQMPPGLASLGVGSNWCRGTVVSASR